MLTACSTDDRTGVATSEQTIDTPFEAVEALNRNLQVVGRGSGFVALQSDSSTGRVAASIGEDGQWGESTTLPLENVIAITVAESQGDVYVVAATSSEVIEHTSARGAGGVAVTMLPAGSHEWLPPTSISAADSLALESSEEFTARAVGAHDGSAVVFLLGWNDDIVELWRIGDGQAALEPTPPAGVVDFCTNDEGAIFGLSQSAIVAGSVEPGDTVSETIIDGSDGFHGEEGDEWRSTPYEPPTGALFESAALACDEDGPIAIWPTEMIDGLTLERHPIPEVEGTFLTQPLAGPGTTVLRSSQQGSRQIDELGAVGSSTVEFVQVTDGTVAAAVNERGDGVIATLDEDGSGDITWHYLASVLPTG